MITKPFTPATTWQTVGPFFSIGLERLYRADIAGPGVAGERIRIAGRLLDGDYNPIPDAVVEVWQANAHGKYAHPGDTQDKPLEQGFRGFGRIATDDLGEFRFSTVKPGSVLTQSGEPQAPHLVVSLMMRGLLRGLVTRAYFPKEGLNATDPVLQCVPPARRSTLLLSSLVENDVPTFGWTIHMQGPSETVFFDF